MDKIEFNELEILKQLEYVNNELLKGGSLRNISKSLSMSKTTIRDRAMKIGYIYNKELGQYTQDNTMGIQLHQNITKEPHKAQERATTTVKEGNTKELQKYSNTKELQKYNSDILELIENKNELLEMLKKYKNNTNIIEVPQLDINSLPEELQKDIANKSIKIYEPVYKKFNEVCNQYGSIKKQDLISLALYEFINRYSK